MKRISSLFQECFAVSNDLLRDSRGYFVKTYQSGDFVQDLFNLPQIDEVFWTESSYGVARGLHLQIPPRAVSKYVMCTSGRILDLILDLRTDSETFGRLETIELGPNEDSFQAIFIPKGFAHGFITLSETATVTYLQNGKFSAEHDTGVSLESVRHLLPTTTELKIDLLSDRDRALPEMNQFPRYSTSNWQVQD